MRFFRKNILTKKRFSIIIFMFAGVAQSVVQLIRNQQVVCSSHITSSKKALVYASAFFIELHLRKDGANLLTTPEKYDIITIHKRALMSKAIAAFYAAIIYNLQENFQYED